MSNLPEIDFERIRGIASGGRRDGFEEFVCQLARHDTRIPPGSVFERFRGAGGDGGVEALIYLPNGKKWGWQSKYFFALDKKQLEKSVNSALDVHPEITRFTSAVPFDPTGKRKGKGKSEIEKWTDWRLEWEKKASSRGMQIQFEILWASDLQERLVAIDKNGTRVRYWFDEELVREAWWRERFTEAANAARPRYVPALKLELPAAQGLDALAQTPGWQERVGSMLEELRDKSKSVILRDSSAPEPAPEQNLEDLQGIAVKACSAFEGWCVKPSAVSHGGVLAALDNILIHVTQSEREAIGKLDAKYGPGKADSVPWREWMREYQVSFPTEVLDRLRELYKATNDAKSLLLGPTGSLAGACVGVLIGAAGVGKTFAAIDFATKRMAEGAPTVVLHGRWFSDCVDPLPQLRNLLRFPESLSPDDALAILDHAGEVFGSPALLIIDELNETAPRSICSNHLERLVASVEKLNHVRLVLTVRTHYIDEVIPSDVKLPTWEHRGFEGAEFEAIFEYSQYYNLEPPATPPAQREFTNPLFLRLLCEAMRDSGRTHVDAEISLAEVVDLLLKSKDANISERLDAPKSDQIVRRSMARLARAMMESGRMWVARQKALEIARAIWPGTTRQQSLLEALIGEGLLSEDRILYQKSTENEEDVLNIVAVPFERLAQQLVVSQALKSLKMPDKVRESLRSGELHALLIQGGRIDLGMLGALSIEIPERMGGELEEVLPEGVVDRESVVRATVESLPWRSSTSITNVSKKIMWEALSKESTHALALDTLFSLSPRRRHPLNADWLHGEVMQRMSMAMRDSVLIPWFFETSGTGGAVDTLIRWARESRIDALREETARLWATALLWCTSSSDRRVRDGATRGTVRLLMYHPLIARDVLERFVLVDDEWIVERALAAVYGALLCNHNEEMLASCSELLWARFFAVSTLPANALIRDLVRCLLEEASARKCAPPHMDVARVRPPYATPWPIAWPDEDSLEKYDSRAGYPKLVDSCLDDDFSYYQIEPLFRKRPGIDPKAAGRWIVHEVIRLGYEPRLFAWFDSKLLNDYGRGRGKPSYIERIGKKYQWIVLARLAGIVDDHVPLERDDWDPPEGNEPPLQARSLRDLDPSVFCLKTEETSSVEHRPWVPGYSWDTGATLKNRDWVSLDDAPAAPVLIAKELALGDRERVLLSATYEWEQSRGHNKKYPYRQIWMHVHGVLVSRSDRQTLIAHFDGLDLVGEGEPRGFNIGEQLFAGEYPFSVPMRETFRTLEHDGRVLDDLPVEAWPAAHSLSGEYEYDGANWTGVNMLLPSERFFGADGRSLQWNGKGGWCQEGVLVAANTDWPGRSELTMDRVWLDRWLGENDMDLVWVEVSCKEVITNSHKERYGRLMRSRALWRENGVIRATKPRLEILR